MWMIIIGAIVSLLVYFFERWWTAHHPVSPAQAKEAFLAEVASLRHFWMGPRRKELAGKLFDKFQKNYEANPPPTQAVPRPLTSEEALALAKKYSDGLTLTQDELKS